MAQLDWVTFFYDHILVLFVYSSCFILPPLATSAVLLKIWVVVLSNIRRFIQVALK